ncbi:MAG TPA: GTPase domain-containing protein [Phormidium sp.]
MSSNNQSFDGFGKAYQEALQQIKHCNILVIGNTGVGKSTLIRAVIQGNVSQSVTTKITPHAKPGLPITLYDTRGLEKDEKQRIQVKQRIAESIKQNKQKEPKEYIHVVWYCVSAMLPRISEIDKKWINDLSKELPVILVITRSLSQQCTRFQSELEDISLPVRKIIPILAEQEITDVGSVPAHGLVSLKTATEGLLDEVAKKATTYAVDNKGSQAVNLSIRYGLVALGVRAVPIPVANMFVSSLLQSRMLEDISKVFGVKLERELLPKIIATELSATGIISLFLENIFKNIPNQNLPVNELLANLAQIISFLPGNSPFEDYLVKMVSSFSEAIPGQLPIIGVVTNISTALLVGLTAIAYIETLKDCKKAEYETGRPVSSSEILNKFEQKYKDILEWFQGGNSAWNWSTASV